MRLHVVKGCEVDGHRSLMNRAFALRHRVFVEEMGWERLRRPDRLEIDQFDHDEALHFLMMDGPTVAIYCRLLPTTRPHLLSDVYPQLAPRGIPQGPDVFEWTRMASPAQYRGDGQWTFGRGAMVRAVLEHCLDAGIETLSLQAHPLWITRFLRLGFSPRPLGLPCQIDGEPVVAFTVDVSDEVLSTVVAAGAGAEREIRSVA